MFKNFTLIKKISLLIVFTLTFLVGTISFSIFNLIRLESQEKYLKQNVVQQILTASEMKIAVIQVQQWLTDISATRGAPGFDDGYSEAENWAKSYREKSRIFKEMVKFNQTQLNTVKDKITELGLAIEKFNTFVG